MKTRQRLFVTLLMAMFMGMQVMNAATKQAYAFLSSDGKTLTFYYDDQKTTRQGGSAYALNTGTNTPKWLDVSYIPITTIVFDSSFKDARPTSTYSWFKEQESLTTITGIENLNTSEVTNMSYMFYACHGLTSLDLSSFDTSEVTDMSYMFQACDGLTSLDLSSFNTSKVTNMCGMFFSCDELTSLNLRSFDTSKVTTMGSMFKMCKKLTILDLSSFNTSKVTSMVMMFYQCYKLTTIYASKDWTNSRVTASADMFHYCKNLVGSSGTTYSENSITSTYARIDGVSSKPGYLSAIPTVTRVDITGYEWPTDFEPADFTAGTTTTGCKVLDVSYIQYSNEYHEYDPKAGDNIYVRIKVKVNSGGSFSSSPQAYIGDVGGTFVTAPSDLDQGIAVFDFQYTVPTPEGGKYIRSASASVTPPSAASQAKAMNIGPAKAFEKPYEVSDPIWVDITSGSPKLVSGNNFEAGHQYGVALTLTAKSGNQWHPTKTVFYINGEEANMLSGNNPLTVISSGITGAFYSVSSAQIAYLGYVFEKLPEDGITTGVNPIDNGQLTIDNEAEGWYTIDGRKLSGKPNTKGIYVKDGRKVVF